MANLPFFEALLYRLWYGPLRQPVRLLARWLGSWQTKIVCGPLKGWRFPGRELVCRLGIYELHVQYTLLELLPPGGVFYDLGANNGYLSLLAASRVGPTGWVYAFEPLPENARRLQELLTVNGIEDYQLV
jgi:hypothetical protein